jgi:hypothetical protein
MDWIVELASYRAEPSYSSWLYVVRGRAARLDGRRSGMGPGLLLARGEQEQAKPAQQVQGIE